MRTISTNERRWESVVRRQLDDAFVYAVKTTGVYCRSDCSSRRPNRANVEFFDDAKAAERAGYRPCKKCQKPDRVPHLVARACRMIETAAEPPTLAALAAAVGLSPFHFHRSFKQSLGVTPKAYADAHRSRKFQDNLSRGESVTDAMLDAGFNSSSRCYERVGDTLGMTPTEFRRGGAGRTIRFTTVPCDLGWMLVAATERGICRIEFDDSPAALEAGLRARFPNARFIGGDRVFDEWVAQMLALVVAPAGRCDLPLDVQSTAFQRQVWQALRAIPAGSTATYTDVAKRIGRPTAVRAVAQACASNPVAVIVPCHRVIGAAGELRGYRWGIERKRKLLERERSAPGTPGERDRG